MARLCWSWPFNRVRIILRSIFSFRMDWICSPSGPSLLFVSGILPPVDSEAMKNSMSKSCEAMKGKKAEILLAQVTLFPRCSIIKTTVPLSVACHQQILHWVRSSFDSGTFMFESYVWKFVGRRGLEQITCWSVRGRQSVSQSSKWLIHRKWMQIQKENLFTKPV